MNKAIWAVMVLAITLGSCKKNDDDSVEIIPPKALSEVVPENDAQIQEYLKTHFYNYEDFANPPEGFDYKIKVDTLAGENSDKTPLLDSIKVVKVPVNSDQFSGMENKESLEVNLYYLIANKGANKNLHPTVADSTFLKYEGTSLDGTLFDATPSYTWQYLPFYLRGYAKGVSMLSPGGTVANNPDGTFSIDNVGVGMLIIPSALGYYNSSPSSLIDSYSPIIFKIQLGKFVANTDYDNDGIPSIMEDLNGNGILSDDNTDLDDEMDSFTPSIMPNHLDDDDDNDGYKTRYEINIDGSGNITFPDTDGDGIPDYLDKDSHPSLD